MPVVLPFGRASEFTSPDPSMSSVIQESEWFSSPAVRRELLSSPVALITSTWALTRSAAYSEIRSGAAEIRGARS